MNKNQHSNFNKNKSKLFSTKLMLILLLGCTLFIAYYIVHYQLLAEIFPMTKNSTPDTLSHADIIKHKIDNTKNNSSDNDMHDVDSNDASLQNNRQQIHHKKTDNMSADDTSSIMLEYMKKVLESEEQHQAQKVEKSLSCTEDNIGFLEKLAIYRKFLLNIQYLVLNFTEDKDYTDNLKILDHSNLDLPDNIQIITSMLRHYNNNLQNNASLQYNQQIILSTIPYLNKLITITKETNALKNKEQLKHDILSKIHLFIKYMYSPNVQSVFFE